MSTTGHPKGVYRLYIQCVMTTKGGDNLPPPFPIDRCYNPWHIVTTSFPIRTSPNAHTRRTSMSPQTKPLAGPMPVL